MFLIAGCIVPGETLKIANRSIDYEISQSRLANFIDSCITPKENSGSSFGGITINTNNTIIKRE